ncbi:MAG: hypothetical protein EA398_16405 [Deltaproteobacteria bacterium]|nr:MAG: hypothetical protein EA398_16405 [Deltaproteobacteria bacterium]
MKGRGRNAKVRKRRRKQRNRERVAAAMKGDGAPRRADGGATAERRVFEGRFRGGLTLRIVFGEETPWSGDAPLTAAQTPHRMEDA